jgi:hypothetical protein
MKLVVLVCKHRARNVGLCVEGMEVKPCTTPTLVSDVGVTAMNTPYV